MPGGVSSSHILIPDAVVASRGVCESERGEHNLGAAAESHSAYSPGVGLSPGFTPLYQPSQPPVTAITS